MQPTYEDCFPLALLEAMQHGLPVVTTDEGAITDMVTDGVNGFLTPKHDAIQLANSLQRLLADPALHQQMGLEGTHIYEKRFSLPVFEQTFITCLQQAMRSCSH